MAVMCPECDSDIEIDEVDVDIGDELSCSECGALLRVASDSPVELEAADDEDDDVDDNEKGDDDEEEDSNEEDGSDGGDDSTEE